MNAASSSLLPSPDARDSDEGAGGVGGAFLAITLIPAVGMAVALVCLGLALQPPDEPSSSSSSSSWAAR